MEGSRGSGTIEDGAIEEAGDKPAEENDDVCSSGIDSGVEMAGEG